jgi:hypothetical protein
MKHRHRNGPPGPIPLDLEHEDRRWLSSEARQLGVRPSELCAFLVRAARKSGLSAQEAGHALATVGQQAAEPQSQPGAAEALMAGLGEKGQTAGSIVFAPYDKVVNYSEVERALAPLTREEALAQSKKELDEIYQRELGKTDAQILAEQQRDAELQQQRVNRPRPQPAPMVGKNGARKDIVQVYPPGSLSEPAGFNDRLSSRNDDDPGVEIIKTNYGHLRSAG